MVANIVDQSALEIERRGGNTTELAPSLGIGHKVNVWLQGKPRLGERNHSALVVPTWRGPSLSLELELGFTSKRVRVSEVG